jgi:hypothetical protein
VGWGGGAGWGECTHNQQQLIAGAAGELVYASMAGPEALQVRVSVQSAQISASCWTCWTFCSGTLHYLVPKADCMFKCINCWPHVLAHNSQALDEALHLGWPRVCGGLVSG